MKRIDIEHLVRWAYLDELPKVAAQPDRLSGPQMVSGGAVLARLSVLHTLVQEQGIANRYGVLPLLDKSPDGPHPDALAVASAVEALADFQVELPEGWNPLTDMGDLGEEGLDAVRRGLDRLAPPDIAGARKVRHPLSRLVVRQAVLGSAPAWEAEAPTRRMVCSNGKPRWFRRIVQTTAGAFGPIEQTIELDGFNNARQRPYPGAYRKFELDPDPMMAVVERGEHELWVSALAVLADLLTEGLSAHIALPPARPARPWEGDVPAGRILPSLAVSADGARGRPKKNSIAA